MTNYIKTMSPNHPHVMYKLTIVEECGLWQFRTGELGDITIQLELKEAKKLCHYRKIKVRKYSQTNMAILTKEDY